MGNLRPIGSEKLQGMDKINRIMEIARYRENIPKPINEDKSTEYSKTLSDGKTYRIDKEKNGYVLKRTISESTDSFDYLEPMKNRKYYSSYSQALKRLNLVTKEVNTNQGYSRNMSLFTESELSNELEEKRYVLNVGKTETKEQAAPAPAPAPVAAAPVPAPAPVALPTEEPTDDLGLDDLDLGDEDGEEENGEEEKVTLKVIQKATGKLAQKIRAFGGEDDDEPLSSKDMKYVINSILSALDLDSMDEEDKEDIMDKIEGVEEDEFGGSDEEGMGDEDEIGDEEVVEPEAEMAEGADDEWTRDNFDEFDPEDYHPIKRGEEKYNDVNQYDSLDLNNFHTKFGKKRDNDEMFENEIAEPKRREREKETPDREKTRQPSVPEWKPNEDPMRGPGERTKVRPAPQARKKEFREYDELSSSAPRRHRIKHPDIDENDASQLEDMFEGMFTESKVDDVLKKYFKLEEKEKNVLREQKENTLKVRNSSVNVVQEMVSMKVMKKYPKAKFLGRTKNNNLVFEHNNKQFRITPKGGIL